MANQMQPWWEQPAKRPSEAEFESEQEHLRAELARAWRARRDDHPRSSAPAKSRQLSA
jgi:hypothetical protein